MLDLRPQRFPQPKQFFLPDKLIERPRTHPIRERPAGLRLFLGLDGLK
jgi:hypothetical protein